MEKDPVTNEEWRAYYLKEAASAIKDNLPITVKQCLENAELFKRLSTPHEQNISREAVK